MCRGMAVDFLSRGVEDVDPRIRDDGGTGERHFLPELLKNAGTKLPEKQTLQYACCAT